MKRLSQVKLHAFLLSLSTARSHDAEKDAGLRGLSDRTRRPHRHANQLPIAVEKLIVRLKKEYPSWCADYKGEFLLGNHRYCYPLTITDFASRYLIACEAQSSTRERYAFAVFERAFEEFGLPARDPHR